MPVDLSTMSLAQLKKLQKDVSAALSSSRRRKAARTRAAAEEAADTFGFILSELAADRSVAKGRRSRAVLEPKYANPDEPLKTWSGRGRRPAWIIEGLRAGKSLDDFAI